MGTGLPARYVRNENDIASERMLVDQRNVTTVYIFGTVLRPLTQVKLNFESTEEATLRVEQTFGCGLMIDADKICASETDHKKTKNNIRRSKPRPKVTKQLQIRQQDIQTELQQVIQRQEQLLQKKEQRQQHKELQRVRQRQMKLHQEKTLQRQPRVRPQEQRRIRQLHSRSEQRAPLD